MTQLQSEEPTSSGSAALTAPLISARPWFHGPSLPDGASHGGFPFLPEVGVESPFSVVSLRFLGDVVEPLV